MMKQRQITKYDTTYKKFDKHSDSEEETELFVRNKTPKREIPTIEKIVEEGDTLQSLAIRYRCTIEDLKRLNNIHKENEIFAKRSIRVPHYPISVALAGVHTSGTSSPNEVLQSTSQNIDSKKLSNTLISLSNETKDSEVNEIIFNSQITQKINDTLEDIPQDEDEEIHLLPQEQVPIEPITSKINCSGADCDISIKALIGFLVIMIFAVPLIYVFYIAEHLEQYQHHNS